jgi:hypothetical protein
MVHERGGHGVYVAIVSCRWLASGEREISARKAKRGGVSLHFLLADVSALQATREQ